MDAYMRERGTKQWRSRELGTDIDGNEVSFFDSSFETSKTCRACGQSLNKTLHWKVNGDPRVDGFYCGTHFPFGNRLEYLFVYKALTVLYLDTQRTMAQVWLKKGRTFEGQVYQGNEGNGKGNRYISPQPDIQIWWWEYEF